MRIADQARVNPLLADAVLTVQAVIRGRRSNSGSSTKLEPSGEGMPIEPLVRKAARALIDSGKFEAVETEVNRAPSWRDPKVMTVSTMKSTLRSKDGGGHLTLYAFYGCGLNFFISMPKVKV